MAGGGRWRPREYPGYNEIVVPRSSLADLPDLDRIRMNKSHLLDQLHIDRGEPDARRGRSRRMILAAGAVLALLAGAIRERIPELAILKTIGFSDGRVTLLVLAEAVLLLLLGSGLGMLVATGLLPSLNQATGGRFPPLFVYPSTWLLALGIAVTLALVIGLPPALRARLLKIVDALAGH